MSLVGTRPILPDELEQYELHHRARISKYWHERIYSKIWNCECRQTRGIYVYQIASCQGL